ncbi:Complement C1q-like protein 4 [Bulinus truncatus]|nr:Complement C1q-like protein 4 [Bulinus truncatus]
MVFLNPLNRQVLLCLIVLITNCIAYPNIAFSTALSKKVEVHNDQTLVYDAVHTNIGGGYNRQTGVFTAPESGVYLFTVSCLTNNGYSLELNVFQNHFRVATAYASDVFRSSSNTVILQLKKGDEVQVKSHGSGYAYADSKGFYNSFSGFRISSL